MLPKPFAARIIKPIGGTVDGGDHALWPRCFEPYKARFLRTVPLLNVGSKCIEPLHRQ
jgi:hypothetical protein